MTFASTSATSLVLGLEGAELATSQRILRDGTIAPPLLKAMPVVGLTIDEVQGRLEAGYTEYLKEPKVTLKVVSIRSDRVFVLGEVRTRRPSASSSARRPSPRP